MAFKIKDRFSSKTLSGEIYTLDTEDPIGSFHTAVRNGQSRLALEYASILIDDVYERLEQLEAHVASEVASKMVAIEEPVKTTARGRKPKEMIADTEEGSTSVSE